MLCSLPDWLLAGTHQNLQLHQQHCTPNLLLVIRKRFLSFFAISSACALVIWFDLPLLPGLDPSLCKDSMDIHTFLNLLFVFSASFVGLLLFWRLSACRARRSLKHRVQRFVQEESKSLLEQGACRLTDKQALVLSIAPIIFTTGVYMRNNFSIWADSISKRLPSLFFFVLFVVVVFFFF